MQSFNFVVFRGQVTLGDEVAQIIDRNGQVVFSDGKWTTLMSEVYPMIEEWKTKKLRIEHNEEKSILNQLHSIRFSSLVWLSLSGNGIESIEIINRIYLPCLEQVWLNNKHQAIRKNYITSIGSLRKCFWPSLHLISFSGNLILQNDRLWEFQAELREIWLDWSYDKEQLSGIEWLYKVQSASLKLLGMNSKVRIVQRSKVKCLQRKFKDIKIYVREY